jgi:cbb3-type cytochrome oxidase maturation protein
MMDNLVVAMMLGASLFLGGIALLAFLWAVKNGQFDDEEKFLNAVKFDNEDDLNDAIEQEKKHKELKKKSYRPE